MYEESVTPYKKRSKRKPPKKLKHKHEYEPIFIIESFDRNVQYLLGRKGYKYMICHGKVCTICEKIEKGRCCGEIQLGPRKYRWEFISLKDCIAKFGERKIYLKEGFKDYKKVTMNDLP